MTATVVLARWIVRRDRVRIVVWLLAIVALVVLTATSTKALYPTPASLRRAAATEDTPVAIIFNGPAQGLDTMGGQIAFQVGATTLVLVGLMTLLLLGRWTRGEEEGGRLELVRSLPVGEHAPMAAALVVIAGAHLALAVLVTIAMVVLGLPSTGSLAFGASFLAMGLTWAAITAVCTQVSQSSRVTGGLGGAALGAAFVLRAIGDIGGGAISWLSPIGWSQKVRPWAGEAWWALLVPVVATAALAALAARLSTRRDFGGGLVAPSPGPASAAPRLASPVALAARLEGPAVLWWSVAVAVMGVAYGSIADSIGDVVEGNESLEDLIAGRGAGSLTEAFLATSMLILALIAAGFAVQSGLRSRAEEGAMRAEAVLATPVSRRRWLASNLLVTVGGNAAVLAIGGFGIGAAAAAVTGDAGYVPELVGAAIAYLPATAVLVGIGAVAYAFVPRVATALWGLLAGCFVIGFFRQLLDLPAWVASLTPFEHTPRLPAAGLDLTPLIAQALVAVGLVAVALAGFRRRDIPSA